jgi:hypothetical protein
VGWIKWRRHSLTRAQLSDDTTTTVCIMYTNEGALSSGGSRSYWNARKCPAPTYVLLWSIKIYSAAHVRITSTSVPRPELTSEYRPRVAFHRTTSNNLYFLVPVHCNILIGISITNIWNKTFGWENISEFSFFRSFPTVVTLYFWEICSMCRGP